MGKREACTGRVGRVRNLRWCFVLECSAYPARRSARCVTHRSCTTCPSGGIGRRDGFKIRFPRGSGGSSPPSGTGQCRMSRSECRVEHRATPLSALYGDLRGVCGLPRSVFRRYDQLTDETIRVGKTAQRPCQRALHTSGRVLKPVLPGGGTGRQPSKTASSLRVSLPSRSSPSLAENH